MVKTIGDFPRIWVHLGAVLGEIAVAMPNHRD